MKYSITSKNYYINFYNNKNKGVKGFQLYEEPKAKNIEKKEDITKGVNILNKYDTQKIKRMFLANSYAVDDQTQKLALLGSLTLYLDFVNLFLYLLRFLGRGRE